MMRLAPAHATRVAWFASSCLLATCALHFAVDVLSPRVWGWFAQAPSERTSLPSPRPFSSVEFKLPTTARRVEELAELSGVPIGQADAGRPAPVTVSVLVSAGPPRSEVFVNGVRRGQTPFIGEVACMLGEAVRVDIVPSVGLPMTGQQRCVLEGIRFTDRAR